MKASVVVRSFAALALAAVGPDRRPGRQRGQGAARHRSGRFLGRRAAERLARAVAVADPGDRHARHDHPDLEHGRGDARQPHGRERGDHRPGARHRLGDPACLPAARHQRPGADLRAGREEQHRRGRQAAPASGSTCRSRIRCAATSPRACSPNRASSWPSSPRSPTATPAAAAWSRSASAWPT